MRPFQSDLLAYSKPISISWRGERAMTMTMLEGIVGVLLLMLLLILILIFVACKPWRFFFSSRSRTIKVPSSFFFSFFLLLFPNPSPFIFLIEKFSEVPLRSSSSSIYVTLVQCSVWLPRNRRETEGKFEFLGTSGLTLFDHWISVLFFLMRIFRLFRIGI